MRRTTLETSAQPEITFEEIGGSLRVKSWENEMVRVDFPNEEDSYKQKDNKLAIVTQGDCLLRVPLASQLHIKSVSGNAHITGTEGKMKIAEIGGNLHLKRVGETTIQEIAGNLNAKDISGNLKIQEIGGNANLRSIRGELLASEVAGNFNLKEGGAKVEAEVEGNLSLQISVPVKGSYKIRSGGNAYCHLEAPANCKVKLESESGRIFVQTEEGHQNLEVEQHEIVLGNGEALLEIAAEGLVDFHNREKVDDFNFNIDLDFMDDFGGVADEISEQVGAQMEGHLEALNIQLESLSERMQISGNQAVKKAQRKVEAAQRRLERKLQARGLSSRKRSGRSFRFTVDDKPAGEPVSEEERMLVLQMVQDKKISVEDAEMLFATLEGREALNKSSDEKKAKKS